MHSPRVDEGRRLRWAYSNGCQNAAASRLFGPLAAETWPNQTRESSLWETIAAADCASGDKVTLFDSIGAHHLGAKILCLTKTGRLMRRSPATLSPKLNLVVSSTHRIRL